MGGGNDGDTRMVPNPFYEELRELKATVTAAAPALSDALDDAAGDLLDGEAWQGTGPATAFEEELTGRKGRLRPLVDAVIADIDAKLASTDATVPADVAAGYRNALRAEGVR